MQFLIDDTRYFMREETDGVFSLMNLKTNQVFSFVKAGKLLLKKAGEWTDLDQFVQEIHTKKPQEEVRRLFSSMLYELHAGGIAQLKGIPKGDFTGIRAADKNDYYHLSAFCRKYFDKGFSCCRAASGFYYGVSAMYDRLKKRGELILMEQEAGEIRSVLISGISKNFFGGSVPELISFIFDETMTQAECAKSIGRLSNTATETFGQSWLKMRYEYTSRRQDFVLGVLEKNGFKKTAEFEAEIGGKGTLCLYDKQI